MNAEVKNFILTMLGAPVLSIELNEKMIDTVIEHVKDIIKVYQSELEVNKHKLLVEEGSLAYCKYILGRIRSKYNTIPGLEGNLVLDGNELISEALSEMTTWQDKVKVKKL